MNINFKALSTPLASIFGSGFLVIVPVLAGAVGKFAPIAMALVCALTWCVGSTIRHNIREVEPALAGNPTDATRSLESAADLALVMAYIISVCLYIHILSAFVLAGIDADTVLNENLLTTAVIAVITIVGLWRGLGFLEALEVWSLAVTPRLAKIPGKPLDTLLKLLVRSPKYINSKLTITVLGRVRENLTKEYPSFPIGVAELGTGITA